MIMALDFAIVLTGTIIPMTKYAAYKNWKKRRQEYLRSLKFYSQFARVFFLENSTYDLMHDKEFIEIGNVSYRKIPVDGNPDHSMGWQEFSMLDLWISTEQEVPERWVKLSGRYLVTNFNDILQQCRNSKKDLIMDIDILNKWAITWMFSITTACYIKHFKNKYSLSRPYLPIETILYSYLRATAFSSIEIFSIEANYNVVTAGVNEKISSKNRISLFLLDLSRKLNLKLYPRAMIFPLNLFIKRIRAFGLRFLHKKPEGVVGLNDGDKQ